MHGHRRGGSDEDEAIADTDPTNATFFLDLSTITFQPGTRAVLTWSGVTGKTYHVLYKTNLLDTTWHTNTANIPGVAPFTSTTNTLDRMLGPVKGPFRLLEMDTQGSESRILSHAKSFLKEHRDTLHFIIEFWPYGLDLCDSSAEELVVFLETHCHALYHINERVGALVPITVDQLRQRLTTNLSIEGQSFINILAVPENTPIDKSSVPADDELKSVFSRIYANQVWNNGDASVPLFRPGIRVEKHHTHHRSPGRVCANAPDPIRCGFGLW